jgi:hypothetical protein
VRRERGPEVRSSPFTKRGVELGLVLDGGGCPKEKLVAVDQK